MIKTLVRSVSLIAATALCLAACGNGASNAEQRVQITYDLKDPETVQFRNERRGKGDTLCGEINAKNSIGEYIGFKRYILVESSTRYLQDAEPPTTQSAENIKAILGALNAVQAEHRNKNLSGPELDRLVSERFFEDKWRALCS
jgi:hypothetical protein